MGPTPQTWQNNRRGKEDDENERKTQIHGQDRNQARDLRPREYEKVNPTGEFEASRRHDENETQGSEQGPR